jgi:intracellular septation protein
MVGAVNLYVAYNFSMDTWVSFKLWSAVLFTILWAVMIGVIMGPYLKDDLKDDASTDDNETTKTF